MSSDHQAVVPQAQQPQYQPGTYVDFLMTFRGKALVPDSTHVSGKLVIENRTNNNPVTVNDRVYFNHRCGAHGLLDIVKTEANAIGVSESLEDYPSYVSATTLGTEVPLERGTTTPSARELRCPTAANARALCENCTPASGGLSFCLKPRCAVNKFNQPVNYDTSQEMRIRIRLADAERFLYGEDAADFTYYLTDLKLHYKVMDPVNYDGALTTEVINSDKQNLNSSSQSISMLIPTGTTDMMVGRLIRADHDVSAVYDKLACEACPGTVPDSGNTVNETYGFERIIYSVNDVDSAPINFNLETREEIIVNYLRALRKDWQYRNGYNLIHLNNAGNPDSYAIGVNFGGLVDFSNQSFTMQLDSQISTNPYNLYIHTRSLVQVA